jgi:hypothetical protein
MTPTNEQLLIDVLTRARDLGTASYLNVACNACSATTAEPCRPAGLTPAPHGERIRDAQLAYQVAALIAQLSPPPAAPASLAPLNCVTNLVISYPTYVHTYECIRDGRTPHYTHVGIARDQFIAWSTDPTTHSVTVHHNYDASGM